MKTFLRLIFSVLIIAGVSAAAYFGMEKYKLITQEMKTLNETVNKQKSTIGELSQKTDSLEVSNEDLQKSLEEATIALDSLKKHKEEADKMLSDYSKLQESLKSMISAGTLSVKIVNGKMVVSLSTDILFPSGSAKLSKRGIETIKSVAEKLKTVAGREYQIEGHTDNQPIRTKMFPSNWELASARAISVVSAMMSAGMSANRLSAASYADTKAEFDNKTEINRAKNRRIEVVIVPDLSNLPGVKELNDLAEKQAKDIINTAANDAVLKEAMAHEEPKAISKTNTKSIQAIKSATKEIPASHKVLDQVTKVKPQFRELPLQLEENELIEPIKEQPKKKIGEN